MRGSSTWWAVCLVLTGCLSAATSFVRAEEYIPKIAPASEEGEQAVGRIRKPDGFKIELVAAEPNLANPVAFCLDEQGRFYVAETFRLHDGVTDNRGNMYWLVDDLAAQTVEDRIQFHRKWLKDKISTFAVHPDRVRQLVDTDGDGKVDRSTVFSDGYKNVEDGIGSGLLANNGDIYYTCIPDLWLLRDEDGDGKAEFKKSLQTGYGVRVSFLGHDLHGLIIGPDGKLYFTIGDRGMNVPTPHGRIKAVEYGVVVRCNLDGSDLEIVHIGLRNPQELAFDDFGNLFTGDNNSDSGDKARLVYIVEGGDSGWRMPYQYIESPISRGPWNEEKIWHPHHEGQPAFIVPPITNFADGPSGLAYNPGIGFPPEYDRNFFLADFRAGIAMSGIRRFKLEPEGAGFKVGESGEFLWNVVATDVDFGYDGCMYVLDWVEGWEKPGKGRIFRVYHPDYREQGAQAAAIIAKGIDNLDQAALLELMASRDRRVRQRAQFALAAKGSESIEPFTKLASDSSNQLARLHAIWGLGQVARLQPDACQSLMPLLTDKDAEVRSQAAKTLGDVRYAPAFSSLVERLSDESPRVRFFAAIALGRLGNKDAAKPLLTMIEQNGDKDPYLRHAGVIGLVGIHDEEAVERAAAAGQPESVRRAALLVMRRWESPSLKLFLKPGDGFSISLAEEAARAVYDLPIPSAMPELAALASLQDAPSPLRRRAIFAAMRLGTKDQGKVVADIAADGREPMPIRREALRALAVWGDNAPLDPLIGFYRPLTDRPSDVAPAEFARVAPAIMSTPDKDLRVEAIDLAGKLKTESVEPTLVEIFRAEKEQAKLRTAALRALGEMQVPDLVQLVNEGLDDERATVRSEAKKLLAKLEPKAAVKILAQTIAEGSIEEKQDALATLGGIDDPAADAPISLWLDKLAAGDVPAEIRLDIRTAASGKSSDEIRQRLTSIDESLSSGPEKSDRYADALVGGDSERGRKIFFEKTAAACLRCHKMNSKGGEVGPDLSKVAEKNDRRALLEAIADPNKKIAEGFDSVVLLLDDGRVVTGVLREETDDKIVVIDAENNRITVEKAEVDERQRGKSAMPEDVMTKLTEMELRDLIEYLSTRK